ncbi:MAG: ATP synthase F0 subunit C [Clostridia bacterium]|nr:ATP synthase F0 subunit C [Clostridia bacterium]
MIKTCNQSFGARKGGNGLTTGLIAIAAAIAIAVSTIGPALGQGNAAARALEGTARQPEAAGPIRVSMILALAFMEALTIYGLLIAFMLLGRMG